MKRHGWKQFLLHDDFYDEDGTAIQPECDVESPEQFPSPTPSEVAHDPEALLDFTITRWHFEEPIAEAWRAHSSDDVTRTIAGRFVATTNIQIRRTVLDVASTIGPPAAQFVNYAWDDFPDAVDLASLAKASASCLPHRIGFDRVVQALSSRNDSEKRDLMLCLGFFRSSDALDWIETNIFSPITEAWGRLAAASEFDWPRAKRWLEQGRPLSLAALDALASIVRPQTPLLRALSPRLVQPPDFDTLNSVLVSHIERDSAPRTKKTAEFILANSAVLAKND